MLKQNNSIFDQGKGGFEIDWIADDNWTEETGMPNRPTTDGLAYANESALLTKAASLGTFTNTGTNATLLFPLALALAFVSNAQAGSEVTFFLTAANPQIGFTFNSRSFATVSARTYLEISAAPRPGVTNISLSETNVIPSATNGAAGGTCYVLSSTNVAWPLNQWTPVATNVLNANGNFTMTFTNGVSVNAQGQLFFILQTQ